MNPAAPQYPIYKRIEGQNVGLPHNPNDPEYTYTASALDLALHFLSTEAMKQAMTKLVRKFDSNLPVDDQRFRGQPDSLLYAWVNQFLNILRHQGPPIIEIDYELLPNTPALHIRQPWDDAFILTDQMVHVSQGVNLAFLFPSVCDLMPG
jgi:hypothetical protein